MEAERKKAPTNEAGNGENYGDSTSMNPIDRTLLVSGVREESPLLKSEEKAAEEGEHPKAELPQDYYLIEAIRRKRVRKGQKQYLIKWHNYPEKDNTWEPLENLQEVSDIINAFEESQSLKQYSRKRKRVTHSSKKRLQGSLTPYSLRCFKENETNGLQQSASFVDVGHDELAALPQDVLLATQGENNGNAKSNKGNDEQPMVNGSTIAPTQTAAKCEENDNDSKPSELKASSSMAANGTDTFRLAILLGGAHASTGNENVHLNGPSNVDGTETAQNDRCKGAKKRKSGLVKRFVREPHVSEPVDSKSEINISGSAVEQARVAVAATEGNDGDDNRVVEAADNLTLVKIITTIGCLPPELSNTEEAFVTFRALRSDGEEVEVNNRNLKASNPLLLINYYEEHLQYNPA